FIVIDHPPSLLKPQLIHLADRHLGIGCDQILMLTPPRTQTANVFCHIYNQDGSEAEQCGNGLRCIARYLSNKNKQTTFHIETLAGVFKVDVLNESLVRMNMGAPQQNIVTRYLTDSTHPVTVHEVQYGNPHAIVEVGHNPINDPLLTKLAHWISTHTQF